MAWSSSGIRAAARPAMAALVLVLAACGGGGGGEDPDPPWSGVTIEDPADADRHTTDQPTVDLAGRAFVPAGSRCDAILGTIADGYRVRWRNAADAGAGTVDDLQLNCLLAVSLTWAVAEVPLVLGDNPITVTARAADGRDGHDTIVVRRVVDTTAPRVTGSQPADGAVVAAGFTSLLVSFSEPVDAASGSVSLRDEATGTSFPLHPLRIGATLDLGNVVLPAGTAFRLRVRGVRDRGGNAMAGEFSVRFATAR